MKSGSFPQVAEDPAILALGVDAILVGNSLSIGSALTAWRRSLDPSDGTERFNCSSGCIVDLP